MDALASFHPAVRTWFERQFPAGPTAAQARGWPTIAEGRDTLIAAPTGSGKTLSAFLVCIDQLYRLAEAGATLGEGVRVVYISPLKALAADIHQNLERPLAEIREVALELGLDAPEVRVALRSGDTPSSQRSAMLRKPPDMLMTTPESLYLMVTAEKSRDILRGARTVIVDEIHALARDKRGSHLTLTLERLDALCEERPTRIGLSATQRPLETVSRLLVGAKPESSEPDGTPRCAVVDEGHRRALDLALELPAGELEAVSSAEQVADVLDQIAALVRSHATTLVFVNTRRMAERLAHLLAERLGEEGVAAHHGSLSRERRLKTEARLRAGDLRVLVATASLELGIDVGPIELVCQIGSPRSLATFLQRVGRSGHFLGGVPKGRLYPLTRDELVECAALLRGIGQGHLDALHPPSCPLDILAQHLVAACASEEWKEDDLYALARGAAPFAELSRKDFDEVLEMLANGIETGRGRRGAYLHRDMVNGVVRGRRGARIAAITSGGAIPEMGDYRVLIEPGETFVGTVGEDWAIESMAGDIFLLGSTSWRIQRVESGRGIVRVSDAGGAPPTVPFWFGEAPARTAELSHEVSQLRAGVAARLERGAPGEAQAWIEQECDLGEAAAAQIVQYLAATRVALGALPTQQEIVYERFFDESGGMQLVVHAPFGGRINRGLGLALRKRFCKSFDFELQAAANDDAIVLSLGPQHSFPLEDTARFLHSNSVEAVLSQALLASPMFTVRWRWNLNRSLAVLRMRGGKRNPAQIQRMEADDLMAAVFPRLAACQENTTGPVEIPDHVIVRQTVDDCLHEAMDVDGLADVLRGIESGAIATHFVDTTEPSPLSHEIISSRPYTFLDDAPLEERRTRAVVLRRGLPVEARELGRLDPDAIARVREEARPTPRDADELHDALLHLGVSLPVEAWRADFEALVASGRALRLVSEAAQAGGAPPMPEELWCVTERRPALHDLYRDACALPDTVLPAALAAQAVPGPDDTAVLIVRGHLDVTGPVTSAELAQATGLSVSRIEIALASLEADGFALRGRFTPRAASSANPASASGGAGDERTDGDSVDGTAAPALAAAGSSDACEIETVEGPEEFCARRLLTRIHRYTQDRLRKEIEPVSAQDFIRFLLRWQHVAPGTQRAGRSGTLASIEQLQGFELAAGSWEEEVLAARVEGYRGDWLDALCLSGEVVWGRLSPRSTPRAAEGDGEAERGGAVPSRATPLTLVLRPDLPWLLQSARGEAEPGLPGPGAAHDAIECLAARGALFHSDLVSTVGRLPVEVEEGLWDLVARGLVTADGFQAVRGLLGSRERWARRQSRARARRGLRRGLGARGRGVAVAEGRWALFPKTERIEEPDELAEAVAEQLLARWGVVFYDLMARETTTVPWRDLLWAFRRMEARGVIRGGRFVSGFVGEQFALPGAVDALRRTRRMERSGEVVRLRATDPLNVVGILTPGPRIPAIRTNQVVYRDGLPVDEAEASQAG